MLKVGDCVDLRAAVRDVIVSKGGIAKSADFVAAGIRAVDVVSLCNAGYLDRVRHGYYQMAEQSDATEEQMLATLIPQGIVCVESALFYYGYTSPRVNGPLLYPAPCPELSWMWRPCRCKPILFSRIYMNSERPLRTSTALLSLSMTESARFAIASNIAPGWIRNCFQRH